MTGSTSGSMPTVALVIISDRPPDLYLNRCLASLLEFLTFPICQQVVVDDPDHRLTASGAVREGWARVENADFVWHMEEDFLLTEPVDIEGMAAVLDVNEALAHLVLKRQPWNGDEIAAGGIIEQWPQDVTDRDGWLEHRKFFSLNPCLVPRRVYELGFPEGSEPAMTDLLLSKGFHFGYWGARHDPPRCHHIGDVRAAGSVR